MKKVIEGKVYNTETAEEVVDISGPYGNDCSNFRWNSTSLYRTKRGNWFIAGEGNAMSRWSQSAGQNSWCSGSGIAAIDEDEARELIERYGSASLFEKYFVAEEA